VKDRFDAILFDNDGVLVDTEPLFLRATQELLATVDVHVRAEDYHEISMRRGGTVFDLATAQGISDEEILELRRLRGIRYSELIAEGVRVLDGVTDTLELLSGVHRTAIVTTSDREHFDEIHAQTDLVRHFEFVLAQGDYTHAKPHPEPYQLAARKMGVDPARCLVIEDTERGLVSATEAGMVCVVIPNALSREGDFTSAHTRLDSMRSLPGFLGLA
jgi:HAD superfamily hydrolase (TIGR01509 family)